MNSNQVLLFLFSIQLTLFSAPGGGWIGGNVSIVPSLPSSASAIAYRGDSTWTNYGFHFNWATLQDRSNTSDQQSAEAVIADAQLLVRLYGLEDPLNMLSGANKTTAERIVRDIRTASFELGEKNWCSFVELNRKRFSEHEFADIIDRILRHAYREGIEGFRPLADQIRYSIDLEKSMVDYRDELQHYLSELEPDESLRVATQRFRLNYSPNLAPSSIGAIRSMDNTLIQAEISRVAELEKSRARSLESLILQFDYAMGRADRFVDELKSVRQSFVTIVKTELSAEQ